MGFTTLGLSDLVLKGIQAAGYTVPTPIQSRAIAPALEGRDIIGIAQTGTGKTAAFVLPMLHRLDKPQAALPEALTRSGAGFKRQHHVRALVVTPTRELAQQVHDAVRKYGHFMRLKAASVYGGVKMDGQLKLLHRGVDIVIATPGRLLDHLMRGSIDLSHVEILVLDEADRMLDMGFINDVRKIVGAVPKDRQTMMFSATMSADIQKLTGAILRNPQTVEAGERRNPAETITQHFYTIVPHAKMDLLNHVLESEKMESVLVFSRTKHGADKICRRLERAGVKAVAIHSNRTQSQRQRALEGFKQGHFRVLVATDIAARGIDIDGISHVINFDIPQYAEDYIHRIGRTGRAGATGDAITFVTREDHQHMKNIERFVNKRFPSQNYVGFKPPAREAEPVRHAVSNQRPQQSQRPHHAPRPASAHGSSQSRPQHPAPHGSSQNRSQRPAHPGKPGFKKRDDKRNPQSKRKKPLQFGRKRSSAKRLESFSSDSSGAGWSNY